jgi:hypothetical protein
MSMSCTARFFEETALPRICVATVTACAIMRAVAEMKRVAQFLRSVLPGTLAVGFSRRSSLRICQRTRLLEAGSAPRRVRRAIWRFVF